MPISVNTLHTQATLSFLHNPHANRVISVSPFCDSFIIPAYCWRHGTTACLMTCFFASTNHRGSTNCISYPRPPSSISNTQASDINVGQAPLARPRPYIVHPELASAKATPLDTVATSPSIHETACPPAPPSGKLRRESTPSRPLWYPCATCKATLLRLTINIWYSWLRHDDATGSSRDNVPAHKSRIRGGTPTQYHLRDMLIVGPDLTPYRLAGKSY
jgi:hypothetical protein